ncbi:MAG: hypothetical protein ACOYXC_18945 [Candidatus Rifleibacteriota bacterium]
MNRLFLFTSILSFILISSSFLLTVQFLPESIAPGLIFYPQIRQLINVAEGAVIALTLLMMGFFAASINCSKAGWKMAMQAGSLSTLLLIYPTYEIYTRSLMPGATDLENPVALLLKCLPGIIILLAGIIFRPGLPGSGFVRGFIAGIIPVTFLGYAWILAFFVHPRYIELISNPSGSLGDCLIATMQTLQVFSSAYAVFCFIPVLTGLIGRLANHLSASAKIYEPSGDDWSFNLVGLTIMANLTLVIVKASVSNSIDSFNSICAVTGYVNPLGPTELIDTLSIFPIVAFNAAVWSLLIFNRRWCVYNGGLNSYVIALSIGMAGYIGNGANSGLKITGFLQMLMGLVLLIMVWHQNQQRPENAGAEKDDSYPLRLNFLGPLAGLVCVPLSISSLAIGLGFVTLITTFTDGAKIKIFSEMRSQSPIEEVWLYGTCILIATVLTIVAFGLGGQLKEKLVALFSSRKS